jgi:hypothetical protein
LSAPTGSFADIATLKGKKDIGQGIDKVIGKLAEANDLRGVIDVAYVDLEAGELVVRRGKGSKDRTTYVDDGAVQRSVSGCVTGFSTMALCSVRSTEAVGLPCAS